MKYTIVTVSDMRPHHKAEIRKRMSWAEEITEIPFYSELEDCERLLDEHQIDVHWKTLKKGELGVWCSQISCWDWIAQQDEPLIVFEDDALLYHDFERWYQYLETETLTNPHLLTLFVPPDQTMDWHFDFTGCEGLKWPQASPNHYLDHPKISRAYQGYSAVCWQIWPEGARKLLQAVKQIGIVTPVDCWIFELGWPDVARPYQTERLNILAPNPKNAIGVNVDWDTPSHIRYSPHEWRRE